jgi:hypothetical protein
VNRRDRRAARIRGDILALEPVRLVVEHARLRGCLCDPPSVWFDGPLRHGDLTNVHVGHDAGCPLMAGAAHRWSAIIFPPDDRGAS